jgi:hypothetical protein
MMNLRVDELDEQYSGDGDIDQYSWFVEEEKDEVIDETESEDEQEEQEEEDEDEDEDDDD